MAGVETLTRLATSAKASPQSLYQTYRNPARTLDTSLHLMPEVNSSIVTRSFLHTYLILVHESFKSVNYVADLNIRNNDGRYK